MKTCNKCNVSKQLDQFQADKRNADGKQGVCSACKNQYKQKVRDTRAKLQNYQIVSEKSCNKCNETKSIDLFYADKAMTDGHSSICKACKAANVYKWRAENKDKYNSNQRAYQKAHPEMRYGTEIKRKYGCTLEQYNTMLMAQEGQCAICKRLHNPAVKKGRLFVDHDHATGAVRALLCGACNSGIGYLRDDVEVMAEAAKYLTKFKK